MFPEVGRSFNATYRCYSVTMLGERDDVERGGKSLFSCYNLYLYDFICMILSK